MLPRKIALVFDGWSGSETHYVAIFATFPAQKEYEYEKILLVFSPFEIEDSQSADDHCEFANFVLSVYSKSFLNFLGLVGNNCNVSKKFADLVNRGFIGCHTHRFNKAVEHIVSQRTDYVDKVNQMMKIYRIKF